MTDSPAAILRQYSVDAALGVMGGSAGDWPWFLNAEPERPDNCVTVYDTDGVDYGRVMPTGRLHGPNGVQVRVRAINDPTGWNKANEIRDKYMLKAAGDPYQRTVTISGRSYVLECVVRIGDVIRLGKALPASRLNLFTVNVLIHSREAS